MNLSNMPRVPLLGVVAGNFFVEPGEEPTTVAQVEQLAGWFSIGGPRWPHFELLYMVGEGQFVEISTGLEERALDFSIDIMSIRRTTQVHDVDANFDDETITYDGHLYRLAEFGAGNMDAQKVDGHERFGVVEWREYHSGEHVLVLGRAADGDVGYYHGSYIGQDEVMFYMNVTHLSAEELAQISCEQQAA